MAWIKLHQTLWEHRKTILLAAQLDIDDVAAAGHMARLWCWALDNAPSGLLDLPNIVIAKAAGWKGDAESFVTNCMSVGFLDSEQDGLYLHDWSDYAGRLIDRRAANTERMRNERAQPVQRTKSAQGDTDDARALPRVEKSREEIKEIISHLNQVSGRKYQDTKDATQKHIHARLEEGYTVDDIKAVIDKKVAEWLNNPKMSKYLRPETLFGSKFEGYFNEPWPDGSEPNNEETAVYYQASAEDAEELGNVFDKLSGQS